jgi:hypothetical protein
LVEASPERFRDPSVKFGRERLGHRAVDVVVETVGADFDDEPPAIGFEKVDASERSVELSSFERRVGRSGGLGRQGVQEAVGHSGRVRYER